MHPEAAEYSNPVQLSSSHVRHSSALAAASSSGVDICRPQGVTDAACRITLVSPAQALGPACEKLQQRQVRPFHAMCAKSYSDVRGADKLAHSSVALAG
ncbi:MAG: hypothetical protein FRX49_11035 [Trebouxia sp. A1-2]|nr:MAG: hypothetical protein FRX49_11035 [Trebouxia sp. A1-2]